MQKKYEPPQRFQRCTCEKLLRQVAQDAPWHLAPTVESLHRLMAEPERLAAWQRRARKTYQERFSRRVINDRWDRLLRTNVST